MIVLTGTPRSSAAAALELDGVSLRSSYTSWLSASMEEATEVSSLTISATGALLPSFEERLSKSLAEAALQVSREPSVSSPDETTLSEPSDATVDAMLTVSLDPSVISSSLSLIGGQQLKI